MAVEDDRGDFDLAAELLLRVELLLPDLLRERLLVDELALTVVLPFVAPFLLFLLLAIRSRH